MPDLIEIHSVVSDRIYVDLMTDGQTQPRPFATIICTSYK